MLASITPLPATVKSLKYPGSLSFMQNELGLEIPVRARYGRHQNVTHPDVISARVLKPCVLKPCVPRRCRSPLLKRNHPSVASNGMLVLHSLLG